MSKFRSHIVKKEEKIKELAKRKQLPYFEGFCILCRSKVLTSAKAYLKPLSWMARFCRAVGSNLLCNLAIEEASSTQLPCPTPFNSFNLGMQPKGGTPTNANFLPPFLYISYIYIIDPIKHIKNTSSRIWRNRVCQMLPKFIGSVFVVWFISRCNF